MTKYFFVRYFRGGAIILTLFSLLSTTDIFAQYHELYLSNGEHAKLDNPNGGFYSVLTKDGKIQSVYNEDPEEVVRLIVTFKDQPLAAYQAKKPSLQKTSMSNVYATLQASHASFRAALSTVRQRLSIQRKADYGYTITRDYYRVLNGVALQCKRGMINSIRALPMVKQVSLDREVKADLKESVRQIRADVVQDSLGYTGKGVLVGDVDTGIDYDNPALGGGFGPAFRVIGGYDFANNDNDPMDDHGHGTHVAGIIGANGGDTLRGVAPEVKFLAVKVLDANGSGSASNVIAGVDYCLDPDNNPATDDAVDVINMSLGGSPSPDDPLESAVDNATKAGVLCVIAAGNSGQAGYGTIGSPGTSGSALTVGACDSTDQIAFFSSLGPDAIHSAIKPEVVAPGVNILSTILNNQTASWSGTSMATPHVAGVAALLKQEHPLWPPEKIKAVIVNSAHSVGDSVSVFAQGKGRVDALDAAESRMVVDPGIISFGYDDLAQDVWKDTVQLNVSNFRTVSQNTQISVVEGIPTGATLTFDKTSFSLAPGEETTVMVILSVPSSVPVLSTEPFAYLGKIKVTSDSDNVIVPFGFIKSTTLVITFDLPPVELQLIDRTNGTINTVSFGENRSKYVIPIAEGYSLDMLATIVQDTLSNFNFYFVHHRIDNPTGLTYIPVSHDEANIAMAGDTIYDIHNNKVTFDSTAYADVSLQLAVYNASFTYLSTLESGWIFPPYYSDSTRVRLFFSPLDSAFYIRKAFSASRDSDNFVLSRFLFGLHNQQDIAIATGGDNLIGYKVTTAYDDPHLPLPSHWRKSIPVDLNTMRVFHGRYGYQLESIRLDFPSLYMNHDPSFKNVNFYFNKPGTNDAENDEYLHNSLDIGASYLHLHGIQDSYIFTDPPTVRTSDFTINENGEALFEQLRVTKLPEGSPMAAALSSAYVFETVKSGDTIKIEHAAHLNFPDYMAYLSRGSVFMGCDEDWMTWEQADFYRTVHGGSKQSSGVSECRDSYNLYWLEPQFAAQAFARNRAETNKVPFRPMDGPKQFPTTFYPYYQFNKMNSSINTINILSDARSYKIFGQSGQCTVEGEYHIPSSPGDTTVFPTFNLLQVAVDGRAVDMVQPDQNGSIRLILADHGNDVTSASISLVLASGDEIVLPASCVGGNEYDASIPHYIPPGFIDVVARMEDSKGNRCELTASPGFFFGNTTDIVKLDARVRLVSHALNNVDAITMQSGDTLKYTFVYTNYGSDTARNVVITFPTTPYFKPIGPQSWTIDSLRVNDTIRVPVNLLFLGKLQSTDAYSHYSPSITWTSGGTRYLREHNVFVDFQNTVTGVEQSSGTMPNRFELYQNYPNPFNPSTTIRYDVPKASRVQLVVYDILGRKVATLVDEVKKAGSYQSVWSANRFASGVYFYRLQAGDFVATKRLLLLK